MKKQKQFNMLSFWKKFRKEIGNNLLDTIVDLSKLSRNLEMNLKVIYNTKDKVFKVMDYDYPALITCDELKVIEYLRNKIDLEIKTQENILKEK